MDIAVIAHSMIQLFVIMGLGYIMFKAGMLDRELNRKLTRILLDVTMPAFILASVLQQTGERDFGVIGQALAVTAAFYVLVPLLAFLLVKIMRVPLEQQGLYMFMYTFSNVGFMGFPVIEALFGAEGILYAAIFNIGFNIAAFTLGVIQINYGRSGSAGGIDLKKLLSPGVLCSVLALVFYLLNVRLPGDIVLALDMVGAITSPLAMILVGGTLAGIRVKEVFTDLRVYPFTLVKLILLPLPVLFGMSLLIKDMLLMQVFTVLILMPVANNSVLFSLLYDNDENLAARAVFITTLLSMVTVPGMLYFLL
ncbi:MAG: AEC family transporter [Firmicutes bacterium]|nr:AEC family transporter [Bacillota bacterium]